MQFSSCVAHTFRSVWPTVMKLYRNVGQHNVVMPGKLVSIYSCAPGVSLVDSYIGRVNALELFKISNFQVVSHIFSKVFSLHS